MEIKIFPRINSSKAESPVTLWESLAAVLKDKINAFLKGIALGREKPYNPLGSYLYILRNATQSHRNTAKIC